MTLEDQTLSFTLGGLAVSIVAAAAGLRLLRIKAVFEYKLALADKELPWAASLYFVYGARMLHVSAGAFCVFALADLAQSSLHWNQTAAIISGVLAVFALGTCSMSMISLAAIDFKVRISRLGARATQLLGGLAGIAFTISGLLVLLERGYFWPPA